MLTDVCNLHCRYCFANEFVNQDANEISRENYLEAKAFILGDGSAHSIGLIGGEPTLHHHFREIVEDLLLDKRVSTVVLYTNGLLIDKYIDILCTDKVHLLVNCNAPSDMGDGATRKLEENLELFIAKRYRYHYVTLGINMYKPDFEYEYFLEILEKYRLENARISITVPNMAGTRNRDAFAYFMKMKPRVITFIAALLEKGIVPNFDCNKLPTCLVTNEELAQLNAYMESGALRGRLMESNLSTDEVVCSPVIDITQDLKAVRCFGLSEVSKVSIRDFKNIRDLRQYYIRSFDAYAFNTVYNEKCRGCYRRSVLKCSGGCLAFKINDILKAQRAVNEIMDRHCSDAL